MHDNLDDALKHLKLETDDSDYAFLKLPLNGLTVAVGVMAEMGEPFSAVIMDAYEVTLIIDVEGVEEYKKRLQYADVMDVRYRVITFDVEMAPSVIGFMAVVSKVLADEGISIMPFAAYSRDHILVSVDDFDRAMTILKQFADEQGA